MALARAPMSAREARALPGFVLRLLPRCGTIDGLSMSTASSSIAPDVDPAVLHDVEDSNLYNIDLAPVPRDRRKWRISSFAALWISMSACIPTYMLASSLIGGGMNWSQAIFTIFLGNVIVVIPMILNAHAGTKYGIPFPVFCRASFGTR